MTTYRIHLPGRPPMRTDDAGLAERASSRGLRVTASSG